MVFTAPLPLKRWLQSGLLSSHISWIFCCELVVLHFVIICQPAAGVMSEIALTGPHYLSVGI
jgi:hypothetical protein